MMKKMFSPAKRDKISTIIIKQIRSAILQGKYQQGESLPTESELVTQFDVSKHTVREALRALEEMGFITVRRGAGGGPVVSRITWETAREFFSDFIHFQDISIQDLSEVRLLMEPYMARKAAESCSLKMEEELKEIHEQCEELIRRKKSLAGAEAEVMFHVLLAKYSGNSALWVIFDLVNSTLLNMKRKLHPGQDFSLDILESHRKILKAILDRDGASAEYYMREHVLNVETNLISLVQQERHEVDNGSASLKP